MDRDTKSIIIKGHAPRLYNLWTDFEKFPHFMKYIKSVRKTSDKTSHWVMEGPLGKDLEWDAEITDAMENKRLGWHSTQGDIKTSGQVTFNELDHGETQVTVQLKYIPPAGAVGKAAAHVFDNPGKKLEEDLREFKKYAETQ